MRIYIGIDPRSPVSYNVLQWSIIRRSSRPVAIVPLVLPQLPITRRGLTDFTYTRYICPQLSGFQGHSLFLDADMLMLGDVVELFEMAPMEAVSVVKNEQRFEWPSMMLFNNEKCTNLTSTYVNDENTAPQSFEWADKVGELPMEWNFCVGYNNVSELPRQDDAEGNEHMLLPKLVHYTMGIPLFPETRNFDFGELWMEEYEHMKSNCSWLELMGGSVHADKVAHEIQERTKRWAAR